MTKKHFLFNINVLEPEKRLARENGHGQTYFKLFQTISYSHPTLTLTEGCGGARLTLSYMME